MNTRKIKRSIRNKTRKFLFNPKNPDKSFDVYIDKNPKDTIPIKYTTVNDVKKTIHTLRDLRVLLCDFTLRILVFIVFL